MQIVPLGQLVCFSFFSFSNLNRFSFVQMYMVNTCNPQCHINMVLGDQHLIVRFRIHKFIIIHANARSPLSTSTQPFIVQLSLCCIINRLTLLLYFFGNKTTIYFNAVMLLYRKYSWWTPSVWISISMTIHGVFLLPHMSELVRVKQTDSIHYHSQIS